MHQTQELAEGVALVDIVETLPDGETVEIVEIIDIEVFAKENPRHHKPRARQYKIKIDKAYFHVSVARMTGRQLLELAGKVPVERYMLSQKLHGGQVVPVDLGEDVEFCAPGVERFMTLPLDQTEG